MSMRAPVKSRQYTARRSTGNYSTSKRQKKRTLSKVTGGFQRLKDFERRVVIPVAINCKGHWPVGNNWKAMTKAEILAAENIATGMSALKRGIELDAGALEYAANCQAGANQGLASSSSYAVTAINHASGQVDHIPPCGTLQKGALLICEPMKWQQQNPASAAGSNGMILTQNPDHAGGAAMGSEYVALMSGQRCMAGFLKCCLRFQHNYKHIAQSPVSITQYPDIRVDAAGRNPGEPGYVATTGAGVVPKDALIAWFEEQHAKADGAPTEQECPITVRVTIVKLRGKLVDEDGDIREDFRILKPFPIGSSLASPSPLPRELPDTTFVPSGLNDAELTRSECPSNVCSHSPVTASQIRTVLSQLPDTTFVPSGLNDAEVT